MLQKNGPNQIHRQNDGQHTSVIGDADIKETIVSNDRVADKVSIPCTYGIVTVTVTYTHFLLRSPSIALHPHLHLRQPSLQQMTGQIEQHLARRRGRKSKILIGAILPVSRVSIIIPTLGKTELTLDRYT